MPSILLALIAAAAVLLTWRLLLQIRRARRYPPGPPQTWLAGNVRDLPKEQSWRTYERWSKEYGPVIHLRVFDKHIVLLNTAKSAMDLLDKRASIYSERPTSTMHGDLVKRKGAIFFISARDSRFAIHRRMMHQTLGPRAMKGLASLQESEAYLFAKRLLEDPDAFDAHIRKNSAAVIMSIAYGYNLPLAAKADPFVSAAEEALQLGAILIRPGYWLVDTIPALKYLPDWFPGAGFKRLAKVYAKQLEDLYRMPIEWTKKQMGAGTAIPSLTSQQLTSTEFKLSDDVRYDVVSNVAGALYVGAADTTLSAVVSFFYHMMLHPNIQRRAQEEVDRVIGHDRLPTVADRESLRYLDNVIAEILRWCPPGPLGIAHKVAKDDVYEGLLIPAGATVLSNIWAIMHDDTVYPDPDTFNPDRFSFENGLKPQEDPRRWVWGFGGRICPGRYLAEAMLFINLSCVLALFTISKPVDENGNEVEPPPLDFTTGITTRVKPFRCRITPRPEAASLIAHLESNV